MGTSTFHESAKIYQFPAHSRGRIADGREVSVAGIELMSRRISDAALGACWYHEAAVEQSDGSRKP